MFNMGFSELALIIGLALILIGPDQLPGLARAVGRFMNEMKRGTDEFKKELHEADRDLRREIKNPVTEILKKPEEDSSKHES